MTQSRFLLAAGLAAAALSLPAAEAFAADRLSDAQYMRLARCAAFASAPAAAVGQDFRALRAEYVAQSAGRTTLVRKAAEQERYDMRQRGRRIDTDAEILAIVAERRAACLPFEATPYAVKTTKEKQS